MLAIHMVAFEHREVGEFPATPPLLLPTALCGGVVSTPAACYTGEDEAGDAAA
jgi:hypothetical protein